MVAIPSLDVEGLGTVTVGCNVVHPTFGPGTIIGIWQYPPYCPSRHSLRIHFPSVGAKSLEPHYAHLRRED